MFLHSFELLITTTTITLKDVQVESILDLALLAHLKNTFRNFRANGQSPGNTVIKPQSCSLQGSAVFQVLPQVLRPYRQSVSPSFTT
jgi:hypothetical protein